LNFEEYDSQASSTMIYPGQKMLEGLAYTALGLGGEAGETVDIIKKIMRANSNWATCPSHMFINEAKREEIVAELGDVLWYLAAVARELGVSLNLVAMRNVEKLRLRYNKIGSKAAPVVTGEHQITQGESTPPSKETAQAREFWRKYDEARKGGHQAEPPHQVRSLDLDGYWYESRRGFQENGHPQNNGPTAGEQRVAQTQAAPELSSAVDGTRKSPKKAGKR